MRRLYDYTLEEFEQMLTHDPIIMVREEYEGTKDNEYIEYVTTLFISERQGKRQYIYREDHANGSWGETWGDTLLQVFLTRVFGSEFDACIVREAEHMPSMIAHPSTKVK